MSASERGKHKITGAIDNGNALSPYISLRRVGVPADNRGSARLGECGVCLDHPRTGDGVVFVSTVNHDKQYVALFAGLSNLPDVGQRVEGARTRGQIAGVAEFIFGEREQADSDA